MYINRKTLRAWHAKLRAEQIFLIIPSVNTMKSGPREQLCEGEESPKKLQKTSSS
jgi:hypothetical protein